MAQDVIKVQLPVQEATQSVEVVAFAKQTVTPANGIKIEKALANKNNSLVIVIAKHLAGNKRRNRKMDNNPLRKL